MKHKKIKISLLVLISFCVIFIVFTEINIATYLKRYGYGTKELPQATLVYFHLSEGFTVENDGEYSVFIGSHSYIYDYVFGEKGYYEADRMGNAGFYSKKDEKKGNDDTFDFSIISTGDWCHWFRVYELSGGYKIEDF